MYRLYKLFFSALILSLLSIYAFSQGNIGSPYTRYSIGDVNNSPLSRNNSLGGLSYTLPYKSNINFVNPAGVADIDTMTFIFDVGFTGGARTFSILEPSLKQTKQNYQISYINFGFSVTKWWKMALGVQPYSNVGYNITSSDSSFNVKKDYKFEGSGGLTKIFWTNAFSPVKNLRLGITASYLFGEIYHYNSILFDDNAEDGFYDIIQHNTTRISDFTFDAGLQYDLNLNSKNRIILGAVYGYNSDLKSFQSGVVYNNNSVENIYDTLDVADERKGVVGLPMTLGFGLGYCYDNKFYIGVDYTLKNWKDAQFFNSVDSLKNSSYFSLGMEYIPAGYKVGSFKYAQSIAYRIGGYFNENYFNFNNGQKCINDFGISFGVGLPLKRSRTAFDISVKLGQRGTLDDNLIKEKYIIVGIGFSLTDIWFIKSRFD